MQNNKPLRQTMPTVAAWIDQHRAVFGEADTADAAPVLSAFRLPLHDLFSVLDRGLEPGS